MFYNSFKVFYTSIDHFACFSANLRCKGMFSLTDLRIAVVTHPFIFLLFLPCLKAAVFRIIFWKNVRNFSPFSPSLPTVELTQPRPRACRLSCLFCRSQKLFKFGRRVFVMNAKHGVIRLALLLEV